MADGSLLKAEDKGWGSSAKHMGGRLRGRPLAAQVEGGGVFGGGVGLEGWGSPPTWDQI